MKIYPACRSRPLGMRSVDYYDERRLNLLQSKVDEAIAHVDQHLHHLLLETVMKIKQKIAAEKKTDKRKLDANAAVKLAEVRYSSSYELFLRGTPRAQ